MKINKNLIWAAAFAALTAVCVTVLALRHKTQAPPQTAEISVDGKVIRTVDLKNPKEPYEFEIETPGGGHNTIRVEKGRIGVVAADCPDKICVRRGMASGGAPIVCLPHRLSVTITKTAAEPDAASGG